MKTSVRTMSHGKRGEISLGGICEAPSCMSFVCQRAKTALRGLVGK